MTEALRQSILSAGYPSAILASILACSQVNLVLGPPTVPEDDLPPRPKSPIRYANRKV